MDKRSSYQILTLVVLVRIQLPQPGESLVPIHLFHFVKEVITQTSSVTAASLLAEAGPVIVTGLSTVWQIITANPILTLFVGASVLSLGFNFFRKAKRAAR